MGKFTENENIRTFEELRYFTGLRTLDLHGDVNLEGEFDLSQHTRLETINLKDTKVSGVTIAPGAVLASIHYSPEIKAIVLKSLSQLTEVSADGAAHVVTLEVENCPSIDSIALLQEVFASPLSSVTLVGVDGTSVDDAASLIYSLVEKGIDRNLSGNIVVASVYNFLPDLINATDDIACVPNGTESEKAFVIHYASTKVPTIEEIGLTFVEADVTYNEGEVPESIDNSVSASSPIFENVDWSASNGEISADGALSIDGSIADGNETTTETTVVTATSKYNSDAHVSRNVSVKRVGISSISLSLDGDAPAKKDDVFTLQAVKDADSTKPYSHIKFEISDESLVELVSVDDEGKGTFRVISEESGELTITAATLGDEVASNGLTWVLNDEIIIDANRTDSEEMAANDRALMDVIYAQGWSASPDQMSASEAEKVTDNIGVQFNGNEQISNLNSLFFFKNTVIKGGFSNMPNLNTIIVNCAMTFGAWTGIFSNSSSNRFFFKTLADVNCTDVAGSYIGFGNPSNSGTFESRNMTFVFEECITSCPCLSNTKGTTWVKEIDERLVVFKKGFTKISNLENAKTPSNRNILLNSTIYVNSINPPNIQIVYNDGISNSHIFIPLGSIENYKANEKWATYSSVIEEYDFDSDPNGVMSL